MNIVHSPIQPFTQFIASRINKYGRMPLEQLVAKTSEPDQWTEDETLSWNQVFTGDIYREHDAFDEEAASEIEVIREAREAYRAAEMFGPIPTEAYREYLFNAVANLETRFYARCDATSNALNAWREPFAKIVQTINNLREVGRDRPCEIQRAERRMEFATACRFAGTGIDWDEYSFILPRGAKAPIATNPLSTPVTRDTFSFTNTVTGQCFWL